MTKIYFLQKSIETEVQGAEQQVKVTQTQVHFLMETFVKIRFSEI